MEQPLRCNNQVGGYCRATLTDAAVVTTCSHIFCTSCADKTGFARAPLERRACPVCRTPLPNHDDAVQSLLNPTEDYKTSVLSGLDPTTIVECAGRALAFWSYQTTQETFYQEHLCKNLTDKYAHLSTAMDKIINEANAEISNLQNRISSLTVDQKSLQQRFDELAATYRDKSKKHAQTQQLYDALKKKVLIRQVETAASDKVAHTLQSINIQQWPAANQIQSPGDHSRSFGHCMNPQRAMSDLHQHEEPPLPQHQRQVPSVGGPFGHPHDMPPPARPARSSSIAHATTPQHRTALSGAARPTANRSQIPMSTTRPDIRQALGFLQASQSSSLRQQITADGTVHRVGTSTPRRYGGISNGMKIGTGRAGAAGDVTTDPRYAHYDAFRGS